MGRPLWEEREMDREALSAQANVCERYRTDTSEATLATLLSDQACEDCHVSIGPKEGAIT